MEEKIPTHVLGIRESCIIFEHLHFYVLSILSKNSDPAGTGINSWTGIGLMIYTHIFSYFGQLLQTCKTVNMSEENLLSRHCILYELEERNNAMEAKKTCVFP